MTDETDIDQSPPRVTGSPKSIWLVYGDIDADAVHSECQEVMWCEDGQYSADVKYVRANLFDAQAVEIERLRTAIQMAITQNECDMLLTGEELRECRKALGEAND